MKLKRKEKLDWKSVFSYNRTKFLYWNIQFNGRIIINWKIKILYIELVAPIEPQLSNQFNLFVSGNNRYISLNKHIVNIYVLID